MLFSCSDDSSDTPTTPATFTGNLIKRISFHGNGSDGRQYFLEYSSDLKITKYDDNDGYKKIFHYDNDLITKIDFYAYCDCGPGTGDYTFHGAVTFEYDLNDRLNRINLTQGITEYDKIDFSYINDNEADYVFYNGSQVLKSGTIVSDGNNVVEMIVNETDYQGVNYTLEYSYNYDNKNHVFSNVKGYKKLVFYNLIRGNILADGGIAPNEGTTNNMISYDVKKYINGVYQNTTSNNSFYYEYGINNFPSKNSFPGLGIYLNYHFD